ncbi:type A flavoprotein [Thermococcus onnurineus NA1]|uniref:Type A flavoprotein n=1 Tax=Thermococcus onnurineus (strain NA1) TaxID=523850 RepID=B6YW28_THEON|nr:MULTISPECIES: FprA family A-type flavoprotein [Thermococcus]ACJ16351.1 type A flavoprotein [Thermococcus onnurineus NA1]NJE47700.1 FprA family A-type flavoprotein [Thermococcus sp. GR7]NJE79119.1 FprA family A-type flavoprotein [Thermococcus sp. GR4]NJF22536.1 FprA family A-type flavoprotein [Thermococcus sp. GR5]
MPKVWTEKILDDPELYLIRIDDDGIKYFEATWDIPEGITYNAYLMKLEDAVVLFDMTKKEYTEEFMEALKSIVNPKEITHIIIHHTEPDHSGALPAVLEANGYRAQLIGTSFAKRFLEGFYGEKVVENFYTIKDGEEMNISGKTFRFITVPWLHWPDTMITYVVEDKLIFSCDAGGGYSIPPVIDDSDEKVIEEYLPHVTKYIVTVIGHYHKYIVQNIKKLKELGIVQEARMILPGHGLIWRKNPMRIFEHYEAVGAGKVKKGKVLVIYDSMYGFVERRMEIVLDELRKHGLNPVVYKFTDKEAPAVSDILGDVPDSEALIIGASTYEAEIHPRIRYALYEILDKANYEKPVLIVGAFGWAGVAGKKIETMITRSKFDHVDTVESRGWPTPEDEERLREGVRKLVRWIS